MNIPRIGVGVILKDGNKVLLGLRKNSHGPGTWSFPGGHLEFGESIIECAARELREETGLSSTVLHAGPYTNDLFAAEGKHYVTLFVEAQYQGGTIEVKEPNKCECWEWFEWQALPSPLFLPIQNLISQGYRPA
ncbi:MAG: NUDIX domain-containing protein [Deltaproteobacteria bacterium]|nr:NUDIX domain-containing protein [Deltaproteobacteria bacterium]